jgi:hypothetical protein
LQAVPLKPLGQHAAHGLDRRHGAFDRLAIARIGHALATAGDRPVIDLGDDHLRFGLGPARDRERAGNRPALGADCEG